MDLRSQQTMRIAHLSLGVSDVEVSERFYRDVLGFATTRRGDEVEVRWDNFALLLIHRPPSTRGKFSIGLRVDSAAEVDLWAKRLRDGGVPIMSGPLGQGNDRQIYFIDPDNYEFEIYCRS